jgi:putative NADH-flavin reductase
MNNSGNDRAKAARSKILVLGATGGTGRLIVNQALRHGHQVTALVRSPEKASELKGATLIVGDVRDEKTLREALKGQDAVVSSLGTPASPPFSSCGVEVSSFDAVSAALPLEAAELAASRHKARSYRHSHSLWPTLVFGRAAVVQHFRCRRHGTSPN